MISAVIVAGGKGTRMGEGYNKVFMKAGGKEIISRTISPFQTNEKIDEIIVVTSADDIKQMKDIIARDNFTKVSDVVCGGPLRQISVANGLERAKGDIVLIHDGARCLVTQEDIDSVISDTEKYGAAAVGVKVIDTLKTIDDEGNIVATVDRDKTVHIHTPQGFHTQEILDLHRRAADMGLEVTDDCSLFERFGKTVHLTIGNSDNIKITTPKDIQVCEEILKRRMEL